MQNPIKISDVINKNSAVLHSDGLKLFSIIVEQYSSGKKLNISFSGLTHCTSAFLNASIGKFILMSDDKQGIIANLVYLDFSDDIRKKIDQVVEISTNEKKRIRHDELVGEAFAG